MSLNRKGGTSVNVTNSPLTTSNATAETLLTNIQNIPPSIEAIAAGIVPGWASNTLLGYESNLPTGGIFDILTEGNLSGIPITIPSNTAEKFSMASTSANDTAAGSGAQTIFILGLDSAKATSFEILALSGTTPVLTVNDYTRINKIFVWGAGATEGNEGTIYLSNEAQTWTAGGVPTTILYTNICIGCSYANTAVYTTPATTTATVVGNVSVSTNVSGTKEVTVYVESRRAATGSAWLRTANLPITTGTSTFNISGSGQYTPGTDIRIRGTATTANTNITVYFVLLNYTAQ